MHFHLLFCFLNSALSFTKHTQWAEAGYNTAIFIAFEIHSFLQQTSCCQLFYYQYLQILRFLHPFSHFSKHSTKIYKFIYLRHFFSPFIYNLQSFTPFALSNTITLDFDTLILRCTLPVASLNITFTENYSSFRPATCCHLHKEVCTYLPIRLNTYIFNMCVQMIHFNCDRKFLIHLSVYTLNKLSYSLLLNMAFILTMPYFHHTLFLSYSNSQTSTSYSLDKFHKSSHPLLYTLSKTILNIYRLVERLSEKIIFYTIVV